MTPSSWQARATRPGSSTRSCANCVDPNQYELFAGQHSMLKAMGQPYSELGRVRIVDTRGKMAVAHVEFSCEAIVPGDIAMPFVEKPTVAFHLPQRFDRFLPNNGKASGRIVLAKDFDSAAGNRVRRST